jgi:beta-1,2-mannobiose phosphorylase / 1,2-beta-oligomannan phosphorylase
LITVLKHGIILQKTAQSFESKAVLNPGCYQEGNTVHMLYRAVDSNNISTLGYCKLDGPLTIVERSEKPVLIPDNDYESHGVEDPRIVKIDNTFFVTYTAYDGKNAMGALAVSENLRDFTKKGIITPGIPYIKYKRFLNELDINPKYFKWYKILKEISLLTEDRFVRDKDLTFFPRKINGQYAYLHRIYPGIQIVYDDKLKTRGPRFWANYFKNFSNYIVLDPKYDYENAYIGGGCPPIETDAGWLLIYHAVSHKPEGKVYHATAALLDLEDPTIEISRLQEPLFSPTRDWEWTGTVENVVFPTGTAIFGDDLYIYYGAADTSIAVASVKLNDLLKVLKSQP